MQKSLTVLVADDHDDVRILMRRFIERLGHLPVLARNGVEALAVFSAHQPDVVLLDVKMPELDGYATAQRIRQLPGHTWTPIIFLSAGGEEADHLRGLEVGGDDYLSKPVSFLVLEAKINKLQRIAEMQRQLHDQAVQLARYHDENENEQQLAKRLMDHIVRVDTVQNVGIQRWLMPAQRFSGDLLASASTPNGILHVILADGTGHGLAAALSVMPVAEIFYSMTRRGFGIRPIVREINEKMRQLLPTGRFVTGTLVAIDSLEQTIEVWNGGNPEAVFIDMDGAVLRSWPSRHPALGIVENRSFDDESEVFHWRYPGSLYMCSDGLIEVENEEQKAFGVERMVQVLTSASPEARLGRLRATVCAHLNGQPAHDDISLIEVDCLSRKGATNVMRDPEDGQEQPSAQLVPQWGVRLLFGPAELQSIDVVPSLMAWLDQIRILSERRAHIFLIVAELFKNALDHGILELNSQLKELPDGFEQYMRVRAERLSALRVGQIEIELKPLRQAAESFVQIRVKDSGRGFDHKEVLQGRTDHSTRQQGRGIALVRDFCESVTYLGNGNEVIARYRLS